jgi:hypothetical protein
MPEIDQSNPEQKIAKSEQFTFSLLNRLGFTISERPKKQNVEGISSQMSKLDKKSNPREVEFEPAGWYTAGKFIATQEIKDHTVVVAFTPQNRDFDAGIFVDKKFISGNHDFITEELSDGIKTAMAVATFETDLSRLPNWTEEYKTFENDFRAKVDEVKSKLA